MPAKEALMDSAEAEVSAPPGNALSRAINAIFVEKRLPYAIDSRLNRLCRAIGIRHKTLKTENGLRFRVRRLTSDENFVHNVIRMQEYTPAGFSIGPDDTVVDIGGNIGTFAVLAAKAAHRGRVFTFEPASANFDLLTHNLAANGVRNATAVRAAVAGEDGTIDLDLCDGDGGYNSTIKGRLDGRSRQKEVVQAVSLKRIFDTYEIEHCDFLKIDCEGAEYAIVRSLPAEYWPRVSKIALEYHGTALDDLRRDVAELVAHLQASGFVITHQEEHAEYLCGHLRALRADEAAARS